MINLESVEKCPVLREVWVLETRVVVSGHFGAHFLVWSVVIWKIHPIWTYPSLSLGETKNWRL